MGLREKVSDESVRLISFKERKITHTRAKYRDGNGDVHIDDVM